MSKSKNDRVVLVAENGIEVTEAMIDQWAKDYERGVVPSGYTRESPVKPGRAPLSNEGATRITITLPKSMKEALVEEAKKSDMTVSSFVRDAIAERIA